MSNLTLTEGVAPGAPSANQIILYPKSDGYLYWKDDTGTERQLIDAALVPSSFTTGDVKLTLKTVADSGWVMMNDGTIGNTGSGATTRANADTNALYVLLWTNCADAEAPVSSGRGASAAADFAAGKTITLTKAMGRAFGVAGAGSGLTSRVLGLATGTETTSLSIAQLAAHTHDTRAFDAAIGGSTLAGGPGAAITPAITSTSTGSGTAHTSMQPTSFIQAMIKL